MYAPYICSIMLTSFAVCITRGIKNIPFSKHQEESTLERYLEPLNCLVAMVVRAALDKSGEEYSELSHLCGDTTRALGARLAAWVSQPSPSVADGVEEIRTLCQSLWTVSWDPTKENPLPDLTERFCILYSLRSDGTHTPVKYITKLFAQLKYILRLHLLHDIMSTPKPLQACQRMETWYTDKMTLSTFSMLCNWQHIASSIVMAEALVPLIYWIDTDHWTEFMYRGDRIRLDDVQAMFRQMEDQLVETWEKDVLLGLSLSVSTEGLTEDLSIQTPGYSFLSDPRNEAQLRGTRTALFDAIMADPCLLKEFTVVINGKREWKRTRLNQWLADYSRMSGKLLLRCEMLSGGPRRGTELTSMQSCSSATQPQRHVGIMHNHVVLFSTYSKTSAISGHDKLTPHLLDSVTADVLLQDLIFARPFAVLAASVCYPNNPEVIDRFRSYLFINNQRQFTTDDISNAMKKVTLVSLGRGYGIQAWRHFAIAWRRKLCPNATDVMESEHEDYIGAEQAGHSFQVERKVYGLSPDALAGPTEDILPLFLKASSNWQKAMKVVPGTPTSTHCTPLSTTSNTATSVHLRWPRSVLRRCASF